MAIKKEIAPGKKYLAIDLQKECPFGSLHQKQCFNCRLAIPRFTKGELLAARDRGQFTQQADQWACMHEAILCELQKIRKLLAK